MFSTRNILYVKDYHEISSQKPKSRYLIVLHSDGNKTLLLSTTTTQIKLPSHLENNKGCILDNTTSTHAYLFNSSDIIGENQFSFP